ncbi:MAG TPA: tyrosine-type recombinase/integrase [Cytophagaceae bacterium]
MAKSKRKRRADGRYQDYVFLGYNPDGTENRKWVYARSEKELDQKILNLKLAMAKNEYLEETNMTVKQWAELWLENYKAGKEYKTYKMYETTLKNHIVKELGHMKLTDVKPFHLEGLLTKRKKEGLTKTLINIRMVAKQMFEDAVENNYLIKNPANKLEFPTVHKPERRPLTDKEIQIVKNAKFTLKQKAFVFILLYAGLRRGEALALTKNDIDLEKDIINVNKTVVFQNNRPILKEITKTEAGMRQVPIIQILKPVLEEYLKKVKYMYLFQPEKSRGLMTESAYRSFWNTIWRCLNKTAGGNHKVIAFDKEITPHNFRHSYATMLYYAGVDVKQAQYLLGHASAEVTLEIYTHLDKQKSAPTDKLNSYVAST